MFQREVVGIRACVYEQEEYRESSPPTARGGRVVPGDGRIGLAVVFSAVLRDGRTVTAGQSHGIFGRRGMALGDVEEHVGIALGRNRELRPKPDARGPLLAALREIGVPASEEELRSVPVEIDVSPAAGQLLSQVNRP